MATVYGKLSEVPVDLDGRVAVKLHMGEDGNPNHLSPEEVSALVERIKENGGEPFLVDTTTLYKKKRYTVEGYERLAKDHGFGRFDVVIARDDEYREVGGIRIAEPVADADSLLVLSHVTGHLKTSIGAAIKNLGMGCTVKDGKRRIHSPMRPAHDEARCVGCGKCVEICPHGILSMEGKEGKVKLALLDCPACGRCIEACPSGAMRMKPGGVEESFREFALAARAVAGLFRGRMLCVNVLKNVTQYCDCALPSPAVCRDIGYLADGDPLGADIRTAELLRKNGADLDWDTWKRFEDIAKSAFKRK